MKLKKLYIQEYKNLKDFTIDFESGNGLSIVVGNNGSGKSNVLEAISGIFYDAYRMTNKKFKCDYDIAYELDEHEIVISQSNNRRSFKCDNKSLSHQEIIKNHLPNNIIGVYSGEEDRLWLEYFRPFYMKYISRIASNYYEERMKLMFVNKYYWNIALLTLLISENETLLPFIQQELGINSVNSISISFSDTAYSRSDNAVLKAFIDNINPKHKPDCSYTIEELRELIFHAYLTDSKGNYITDSEDNRIIINSGTSDLEVLNWLIQAYMPKNNKIITSINILINDNITVTELSEGEKKLILVKTVLELLSDEKTLLLMDEPDAHLHEVRKKHLYSLMSEYPNRQIVLTTHSPTFIDIADDEQLVFLKCDKEGNADLFNLEKLEAIRKLTGSRINAFLEKPILYCEGTDTGVDYSLYPILFPDYKVIPVGGHNDVISCTKAYNRTFGDNSHYAIGIIDWDYKLEEQISALKEEKVYSLNVVEVENVLLDLTLLEAAKDSFCADDNYFDLIKQYLFDDCKKRKEYLATKYTANRIVSQIKSEISPEGGKINKFKSRIQQTCDLSKIDELYNQRIQSLDKYLADSNFDELVRIYDFNHNIDRFLKALVDNYQDRILRLIQKREDLQQVIKSKYYPEIV